MQRQIKFRAWDKELKRWVPQYESMVAPIGKTSTWSTERGFTLMQYTGLKDKDGVDIYEGDIVKILYTDWPSQLDSHPELSHEEYLDSIALTRVVIWSVQGFYVSHKVDGYAESMEPGTRGYIKVIGNIYENPELLEANQ